MKTLARQDFIIFTLKANDQKQKQACCLLLREYLQTSFPIPCYPPEYLKYLQNDHLMHNIVCAMFMFSPSSIYINNVYGSGHVTCIPTKKMKDFLKH